jgi:hypothetical protein
MGLIPPINLTIRFDDEPVKQDNGIEVHYMTGRFSWGNRRTQVEDDIAKGHTRASVSFHPEDGSMSKLDRDYLFRDRLCEAIEDLCRLFLIHNWSERHAFENQETSPPDGGSSARAQQESPEVGSEGVPQGG